MTSIEADRYYDDGPLVVRVEHVVDDGVVFVPVQAGGQPIPDGEFEKVSTGEFDDRFGKVGALSTSFAGP